MPELVRVSNRKIPEVWNTGNPFHTRYLLDRRMAETHDEQIPGFVYRNAGPDYAPKDRQPSLFSGESVDLGKCNVMVKLVKASGVEDLGTHIDGESFNARELGRKDMYVHYEHEGHVRVTLNLLSPGFENPYRSYGPNEPRVGALTGAFDFDHVDPTVLDTRRYDAALNPGDALVFMPSRALHKFVTIS